MLKDKMQKVGKMRHSFAGVGAVVEDEAVAAIFQAEFLRDFGGFEQQMTEDLMVCRSGLGEARNALVVRAADALIAVGGGYGTLSEIGRASCRERVLRLV